MQKKEFRRLTSRTRRAARTILRKVDKLRTRLKPKGLQLMGCLDLPTIKEAILQGNFFHASADHKIGYVLIQNVEFRQLGNVLIIQPTGGDRERRPPFAGPLKADLANMDLDQDEDTGPGPRLRAELNDRLFAQRAKRLTKAGPKSRRNGSARGGND